MRRPDAPLPRQRHKIFAKIYFTDRRGELCSPALEVCVGREAEIEWLLHLYQNIVTLARQRVVESPTPTTDSATAYTKSTPPQAPLQGSWIGEAKTEGLAREIRTKFIDPHLVGTALAAVRYRRSRYKVSADLCGRGRAPSLRPELNQHGAVTKPAHPQPRYKTAMP